ncbi:unnamed protein product [Zymoseptoria tritici ST99CH_1A5]|uniref:AB hydrolase-1 domain-containing protein n=1 Tax=Zymoseptoria tritici ST99CH_1A5 TaxID=1276529 RepID=A0A1Y6LTR9_ZYMTR|nr:unnamed protein product [Zymoseptoria tritici ST99CH_1A5]
MSSALSLCGKALAEGVAFLYGCTVLTAAFTYSIFQREFWFETTDEETSHLRKASHELWSLSVKNDAISHNFLRVPSGPQLHYLEPREQVKNASTLVVLLHGFPDSGYLFSRQLRSWRMKAAVVALDLPGYGGSDSLPSYGPDQMLNTIAEALIELKRRYLGPSDGAARCVLVGHDWGGVIGYRIAAESKGLIDEFVAINSIYPRFAAQILKSHVSQASQYIAKWEISQAKSELAPVASQLKKSGYTYMLTLPLPLAKLFPRVCTCLIKLAHAIQYKHTSSHSAVQIAIRKAKSHGPGPLESKSVSETGLAYGPSVYARSLTRPPGDWGNKIRLYSDGLLRQPWTPSYDGRDKQSQLVDARLLNDSWTFKCPVSIIFGLRDVALDPRVVLDGIEDHFQPDSEDSLQASLLANERITRLPKCGHWSLLEHDGAEALNSVISRICLDDRGTWQ